MIEYNALKEEYDNGVKNALNFVIEELNKLVGYYEQPQDQFEMGFRQGIYRAKMKVEEILKKYKEE